MLDKGEMRVVASGPARGPATHAARIAALEEAQRASDTRFDGIVERLMKIETIAAEIYELLTKGKGALWLATKIFAGITGLFAIGASAVAIMRYFWP